MEKSVCSIRNAVRYVRSSGARLDEFKSCVEKEKVECNKICILDIPTRWNSTFLMLDTTLELKKGFVRLDDEEDSKYKSYFDEEEEFEEDDEDERPKKAAVKRVGPPNDTDWDNAAIFVKFLKVFYDVTLNVSASLTPTAHKAFHDIVGIKAELEELNSGGIGPESTQADKVLYNMAVKMKAKYSKYFGSLDELNQLFLVALVLVPRYKFRNIAHVSETMLNLSSWEIKEKCDEVKQLVVDLCDLYGQQNGASSGQNKSKGAPNSDTATSKSRSRTRSLSGKRAIMQEEWNRQLEQNNEAVVGHEVDRYLLDLIENPIQQDDWKILDWWKLNGGKYPNLQALARDVLAIQVSTVASESSFSTGKRVIDPYRSSLNPKTVEKLICLQNWLKSDAIMGLEYIPTIEEMESYENIEADRLGTNEDFQQVCCVERVGQRPCTQGLLSVGEVMQAGSMWDLLCLGSAAEGGLRRCWARGSDAGNWRQSAAVAA
ncbi:zinc finger BED domain-containing protein RICESLEEPER 2-like [Rosa chinensis]|uniref:zinc finger BED domain-containing protein RICESLEEPER 2-like n=1 Tax=Rosa chinensis TaxID=74649 RepID=UPI001AD8F9EC|nr:zinc finger BED domain-containing protein RICESLEEPER 2-like [Rosa chinensis]